MVITYYNACTLPVPYLDRFHLWLPVIDVSADPASVSLYDTGHHSRFLMHNMPHK